MRVWRGVRDVYRKIRERKIKCIERIIWANRKCVTMNKK